MKTVTDILIELLNEPMFGTQHERIEEALKQIEAMRVDNARLREIAGELAQSLRVVTHVRGPTEPTRRLLAKWETFNG